MPNSWAMASSARQGAAQPALVVHVVTPGQLPIARRTASAGKAKDGTDGRCAGKARARAAKASRASAMQRACCGPASVEGVGEVLRGGSRRRQ